MIAQIKENFNRMLDQAAQVVLGTPAPAISELYDFLLKMYADPLLNRACFEPVPRESIIMESTLTLTAGVRGQIIDLFNEFVVQNFNNETPLSKYPDKVRILLSVIKLAGLAALDAIEVKIQHGRLDPSRVHPHKIEFAGTNNPSHYPHILTCLETLAYADQGDVVEYLIHAVDPRKTDLLHFYHRFKMGVDIIRYFEPLIQVHDLDRQLYDRICQLAEEGIAFEGSVITLDTPYTARAIHTTTGKMLTITDDDILRFLPADGESKFYRIMSQVEPGIEQHLAYVAGSDHRNLVDTHKLNMGLMLDTVGKLALKAREYNDHHEVPFNFLEHHVSMICNIRRPDDINNEALLVQLGLTFLGLEPMLLSRDKLITAYAKFEAKKIQHPAQIKLNVAFIRENMTPDFFLKKAYFQQQLNALRGQYLLSRPLLKDFDNPENDTMLTLADALTSSEQTLGYFELELQLEISCLLEQLDRLDLSTPEGYQHFVRGASQSAVRLMCNALGLPGTHDADRMLAAIEKFLGISLKVNFASTAFSSTQLRSYFVGESTESWAAMMLPFPTLQFIKRLISTSAPYYRAEAHKAYDISTTMKTLPKAGISAFFVEIPI